jgi:hypothetical protein
MAKPKTRFLVDTAQDDREARRAVRGLRAMAKMGRLAASVLAEIEAKGHSQRRAPWLGRARFVPGYSVRYSRFPAIPPISREAVPGYGRLEVRTPGTPEVVKSGSFEYLCYDVFVRAAVPVPETSGFTVAEVKVGRVKLNVESATFYPLKEKGEKAHSVALLKNVKPMSALQAARAIARSVAGGKELRSSPFAAVYLRSLESWLVEDGHAEAFLTELREFSLRHRLVNLVMSA